MLEVTAIPAFDDNYIWVIHDGRNAVMVDPGDAAPVLAWLSERSLKLTAILLTHHHGDHTGGVMALVDAHPGVVVIGHAEDAHRLPALGTAVKDGDSLQVPGLDLTLEVLTTPGHTVGHICYFGSGLLFCGDTLFSAGCGRMFEGTPLQFQSSLARLAALPVETQVFAAHEYTLGNIAFAAALTPDEAPLSDALHAIRQRRAAGHITLPSTIGWERRHNPFLRCDESVIAQAVNKTGASAPDVFAAVRRAKDGFRAA
ncbi:MAG: hydroxyacylglutathione hydrolase [Stagnimonas sp.]|nr:hydroxyacylglutathione hydrolase [Stagnimonas sp.]